MMAAMQHRFRILGMTIGAALALLVSLPAQAQFYDLDGAYHCLMTPDETCKKAETPLPPAPPPQAAPPTIEEAIGKIRAQAVTAADIAVIEKEAGANEPRAVEALAWCKLNGIGMAADVVEAFRLYGDAAQLGIPTAQANQTAIFETVLSPEQRQLVLMRGQIEPTQQTQPTDQTQPTQTQPTQ
jgi:TPR repeat protein